MSEVNYLCSDIGDHELVTCNQYPKGGISAIALLELDHTIADWSNATQWTTNRDNGKAHIIGGQGFKAEYPDASPVEGENPSACGAATILDALDHVVNAEDYNVKAANDTFWENANGQIFNAALFHCVDETISVIEQQVTVVALPPNAPKSNREKRRYMIKLTWTSKPSEFPVQYTAPSGIFN